MTSGEGQMKRFLFTLIIVHLMVSPNLAAAEFRNGEDFLKDCEQHPDVALEFVVGVADTIITLNSYKGRMVMDICLPQDLTAGEMTDFVCDRMGAYSVSGRRYFAAANLTLGILNDEFPCPRSP